MKNPTVKTPSEENSPNWLHERFPDAQGIFNFAYENLNSIKENCYVILDTSVLLSPFDTGAKSFSELRNIYKKLSNEKRLFIPAQAAREFAGARSGKLADSVKAIRKKSTDIKSISSNRVAMLEGHSQYEEILKRLKDIAPELKVISSELDSLSDSISENIGDDPVSIVYREIFSQSVIEDPEECLNKIAFEKEKNDRYAKQIPPGYADASKDDGGFGDLLIWKTILNQCRVGSGHSCIFVTNDTKKDWYTQLDGPFQPRLELLEEFRKYTKKTLQIIPLSKLLTLFGASPSAVEETHRTEIHNVDINIPKINNTSIPEINQNYIDKFNHIVREVDAIDNMLRYIDLELENLYSRRNNSESRQSDKSVEPIDKLNIRHSIRENEIAIHKMIRDMNKYKIKRDSIINGMYDNF